MKQVTFTFSNSRSAYYFDTDFSRLQKLTRKDAAIVITDENIFNAHKSKLKSWSAIVLKPGEKYKVQPTVDAIIEQLIAMEASRKTLLIGLGGGVITDITGYVASIYMRGMQFGFVPTSLLGMVDAAIGGKNGIDKGVYKNMIGTIRQPQFLLYDTSFLKTLPESEWINGFAEIIKHACIKDPSMFRLLEKNDLKSIRKNEKLLAGLIERNARLKTRVVLNDEYEEGERKLLNFGHTLGHALENQYELSHGQAIAIGMAYACSISENMNGFKQTGRVISVLQKYGLPVFAEFDKEKVFKVLKMDKKREKKQINYILLEKIGKGVIKSIPLKQLEKIIGEL